ncbi:hypothetical protein F4679DRAFT_579796 [Xylaria curta]|nr:hypothetical protein F4679DRAFT_579796 [Xylaria curta]
MAAMRRFVTKLDGMSTREQAMEYNDVARIINIHILDRNAPLTPLRAIATNAPIVHFPPTKAALARLDENEVDYILQRLDEPLVGNLKAKKHRLKMLTGATDILYI